MDLGRGIVDALRTTPEGRTKLQAGSHEEEHLHRRVAAVLAFRRHEPAERLTWRGPGRTVNEGKRQRLSFTGELGRVLCSAPVIGVRSPGSSATLIQPFRKRRKRMAAVAEPCHPAACSVCLRPRRTASDVGPGARVGVDANRDAQRKQPVDRAIDGRLVKNSIDSRPAVAGLDIEPPRSWCHAAGGYVTECVVALGASDPPCLQILSWVILGRRRGGGRAAARDFMGICH